MVLQRNKFEENFKTLFYKFTTPYLLKSDAAISCFLVVFSTTYLLKNTKSLYDRKSLPGLNIGQQINELLGD